MFVIDDYDMGKVDAEAAGGEVGEEFLGFSGDFRLELFRESFYENEDGGGEEDGVELGVAPGGFY